MEGKLISSMMLTTFEGQWGGQQVNEDVLKVKWEALRTIENEKKL